MAMAQQGFHVAIRCITVPSQSVYLPDVPLPDNTWVAWALCNSNPDLWFRCVGCILNKDGHSISVPVQHSVPPRGKVILTRFCTDHNAAPYKFNILGSTGQTESGTLEEGSPVYTRTMDWSVEPLPALVVEPITSDSQSTLIEDGDVLLNE